MKYFLFLLFFTGLISSAFGAEQIRIRYNGNLYPLEFTNERGKADGFAVDLIFALARESGLEVLFSPGDWRQKDRDLLQGPVDFSTGYRNKNTTSSIIYSKSLFTVPFSLVYRRSLRAPEEEGLYQSIPLVSSGDSSDPLLTERSSSDKIIRTKSWSDAVKALDAGYGDYAILSTIHWDLLSAEYGDELTTMENFDYELPFVLYTTKWNSKVLEKLNNSLSIIRASGEYSRIYRKWFGEKKDAVIVEEERFNWTGIIAAFLTAALILIVITIRKRKVMT